MISGNYSADVAAATVKFSEKVTDPKAALVSTFNIIMGEVF